MLVKSSDLWPQYGDVGWSRRRLARRCKCIQGSTVASLGFDRPYPTLLPNRKTYKGFIGLKLSFVRNSWFSKLSHDSVHLFPGKLYKNRTKRNIPPKTGGFHHKYSPNASYLIDRNYCSHSSIVCSNRCLPRLLVTHDHVKDASWSRKHSRILKRYSSQVWQLALSNTWVNGRREYKCVYWWFQGLASVMDVQHG